MNRRTLFKRTAAVVIVVPLARFIPVARVPSYSEWCAGMPFPGEMWVATWVLARPSSIAHVTGVVV